MCPPANLGANFRAGTATSREQRAWTGSFVAHIWRAGSSLNWGSLADDVEPKVRQPLGRSLFNRCIEQQAAQARALGWPNNIDAGYQGTAGPTLDRVH